MVGFYLESWAAVAPGMECQEDWLKWFESPVSLEKSIGKPPSLKQIPPMLRRRFSDLGKSAAVAAFPLLSASEQMPCIFASRHGDTELTLSLLETIAREEPLSPTGFSLAVHNAVSGLFSIVRKDVSAVTAIAATEGLIASMLLEAIGQLEESEKVLCIVYDVPLPELYQPYAQSDAFPYACAMILSRSSGEKIELSHSLSEDENHSLSVDPLNTESLNFIRMLVGRSDEFKSIAYGSCWQVKRNTRVGLSKDDMG